MLDHIVDLYAKGKIDQETFVEVVTDSLSKTASPMAALKGLKKLLVKARLAKPKFVADPVLHPTVDGSIRRLGKMFSRGKNLDDQVPVMFGQPTKKSLKGFYELDATHGGFKLHPTLSGKAFGWAGAGAGTLAASHGVSEGLDKVKSKRNLRVGYQGMLKENPDLTKRFGDKTVKNHFRVLSKWNPEMAKDPTVAGSWVRLTGERAELGLDPKTIKELADIRKSHMQARSASGGPLSDALKALKMGTLG